MLSNYIPDHIALQRDPNLSNFDSQFDAGAHSRAFESEVGQQIYDLLTSRIGVAMLVGAVCSASSRPPVAGIEPLLSSQIGDAAFEDAMKRLTGRIVRYIIEHVGGRYETRGVKVTKTLNSHYASGSTYSFPTNIRESA
ncbi:hypothetical protein [Pseudopontixanthobacter vadosimaris]|uniref:hypothetical protein n=1 Tax=Pseudopontixanthobacter vadosimaris TaxID=2726450 RepID=UPI001F100C7B|nr:hypothetical protein [Pseudopontixanthobacter vadosimaris]